jgi:hypothetical protein
MQERYVILGFVRNNYSGFRNDVSTHSCVMNIRAKLKISGIALHFAYMSWSISENEI